MRTRLCAVVALMCLATFGTANAQETRGNISGTIQDAQGVVPGAAVRVTNTDTNAIQSLVTNDRGYFEAPLLNPGNYSITVEMPGFKTTSRTGLVLAVGQQLSVPITLEVGERTEQVTVTAEAPLLDTTAVSSGQNFDSRMVESLPMFSNMPVMLTRFAAGVNPSTTQSLVSQGFVDGTTQAAGGAIGGAGSNNYSIDGASNNGSNRRIASSPNSDTIQEMRVESSNFDASVGHGLGLQISMMTRAGTNQHRGTVNYNYWTNKFNELNPSQRLTLKPGTVGRELYEQGRSHNAAFTLGGPVVLPGFNGRDKVFFFANYSYVNDYIPGKNQASSTVPANERHLRGDFSDLLTLPNAAQYQIYDPLSVRPDPARPGNVIRTPFPNNIIPADRIFNPDGTYRNALMGIYARMVPPPNQNFVEQGTTPSGNYYRGGEPDIPVSHLFGGRIDWNKSAQDRFFFRGSGSKFIEAVSDWTYEVPEFQGLHSIDRARYTWAGIGNWTRVIGSATVLDTQVSSNEFWQDDLMKRRREYTPTDFGFPAYLNDFCARQNGCMIPTISIGGYQGISGGLSSADTTRNVQGQVNLSHLRGAHSLRTGVDVRTARRTRGPGGSPSGTLTFDNTFTRQANNVPPGGATPSNLGLSLAAFMLGIPTQASATIQPTTVTSNNFFATYAQDTWRVTSNLTINYGLRYEWENGIRADGNAMLVGFDENATPAISSLAEAAYASAPIPEVPASQFRVRGGSIYASATADHTTWKPEHMWMPRLSLAYKLGTRTVVKAGYGLYYDTLNANDYNANVLGYSATTANTNSTDFGQTFLLGNPYAGISGIADPFPSVRQGGVRFDEPYGDSLGADAVVGNSYNVSNMNRQHERQQRWRVSVQREIGRSTSIEVAYDGSYADRLDVSVRQDYLPEQYWIPGSLNARDAAAQSALTANVTNPYQLANFAPLASTHPQLFALMSTNSFFTSTTTQRHRLLRAFSHLNNLTYANLPLGEAKVRSFSVNLNRRFAAGFSANMALAFSKTQSTRTVEEYDRAPTMWVLNNDSRPYRISGAAVYELPFGRERRWLNGGGVLSAIVGRWQVAGTFEHQPGSLLNFNNLFYYGSDVNNIKKSKPEIALNTDGTIDADKYWFNVADFETNPTRTPTSLQTRAFPFYIEGLRGPGLTYVNMNVVRNFDLGNRRTIQARLDIQNLFNYAAFGNPVLDPTNTNFGKVVSAVSSAGAMRFFNFGLRLSF